MKKKNWKKKGITKFMRTKRTEITHFFMFVLFFLLYPAIPLALVFMSSRQALNFKGYEPDRQWSTRSRR